MSVPRDTQKCEQEDCAEQPFQAQSVSHRTDETSLESKRTPRDFPRRLYLYPVPSAAAQTAPNGVKERASFFLAFRSLNTTSSHRMFSMGYKRAKEGPNPPKEALTFKKEFFSKKNFFGKKRRDHYPRALMLRKRGRALCRQLRPRRRLVKQTQLGTLWSLNSPRTPLEHRLSTFEV